jgi:hypothetical protein
MKPAGAYHQIRDPGARTAAGVQTRGPACDAVSAIPALTPVERPAATPVGVSGVAVGKRLLRLKEGQIVIRPERGAGALRQLLELLDAAEGELRVVAVATGGGTRADRAQRARIPLILHIAQRDGEAVAAGADIIFAVRVQSSRHRYKALPVVSVHEKPLKCIELPFREAHQGRFQRSWAGAPGQPRVVPILDTERRAGYSPEGTVVPYVASKERELAYNARVVS